MPNLPKDFDAEDHKRKARKFSNMVPTRENCDLADPLEMFLWTYVALPGMNGGQMGFPSSYGMLMSKHQFEVGVMLQCPQCGHSKQPEKVYVPPAANDPHWMTSPGKWTAPENAPKRDGDPLDAALDGLTHQQQAALFERLQKKHQEGVL
ncbi:phage gene 29 protein family protein [Mycolicibacterium sphagni]|uniref:Uncharacterized protein n=1 Tax=Mycolicibacterium sphagni TaxID=1786 RepID=A0A255DM42_9MYCO|nr:DUF2744 domain-containing protein [Mycolicibacterium sphagni]OYN80416.1 hypothetical protein CG716_09805 [Mycolicibacterium sphagni]